jgi:hypothetical protein
MRWKFFERKSFVKKTHEVRVLEFQLEIFMRTFMRWVVWSFLVWAGFESRVRESRGNSIERGESTMTKCSHLCRHIEDNVCAKTRSAVFLKRDYEYVWIAWTMKQARCMESLLIENSVHPFFWGSVLVCEIEDTCKARMKCQDERGHMIGCHFTNISNIKYILALY